MGNETIFDIQELGQVFAISTKAVNPNIYPNQEYKHFSIPAFDESKTPIIELGEQIKSNKYLLEKDSILVSKLNPRIKRVWQYKHSQNEAVPVCSTEFIVYQSKNPGINMNFYYHYFNSDIFQEHLLSLQSGTTGSRMRVTPKDTLELNIPVPPTNEQQKIAEILFNVDVVIEKTAAIIEQAEELKKGLMQQLLTKGIGHTKFKKTEIGEIPEEWEVKTLEEVAIFQNGKAHEQYIEETGNYIVVNSKFISSEGTEYKKTNYNLLPLDKGDIAMVMSDVPNGKALAKCFLVKENNKYTLNQRVCSIKSRGINNEYLYYALNRNKYYLAFDNGVGQTNLRKNEVLECPILVPQIEEQENIVSILKSIDSKLNVEERFFNELVEMKKGLMQSLLTGKVRVKVDEAEVTQV